jgi:hypothetical protein
MHSNFFSKIVVHYCQSCSSKVGLSSLNNKAPNFLITVKCWENTVLVFGVFPFDFIQEKDFSVARLLDCKLVRYCNIDVFLLVSHLFLCTSCTDLDEDMMSSCRFFFVYKHYTSHDNNVMNGCQLFLGMD